MLGGCENPGRVPSNETFVLPELAEFTNTELLISA